MTPLSALSIMALSISFTKSFKQVPIIQETISPLLPQPLTYQPLSSFCQILTSLKCC